MLSALKQFISNKPDSHHWSDVELGSDFVTRKPVLQSSKDRALNNIILGDLGSGRTVTLLLPILNNDLRIMAKFINDFPSIYDKEDFHTNKVKGLYLNGISVIEPTNDLCRSTFELVKAHKIPGKSVIYIDPTNSNTPSINPMNGPVHDVAEIISMFIKEILNVGDRDGFFAQIERNHLIHYVHLLKLHDPTQEVTFDMLIEMYNNTQLVHEMHVKLKETIPSNIDELDESHNWKFIQQIDEWFDKNVVSQKELVNSGESVYEDVNANYIQGIKHILNDLGANPYLRRVLFGESDFSFDEHVENGGVLLVNTAKGELGKVSDAFGMLILQHLQRAVFRKKNPMDSNCYHHILADNFTSYAYPDLPELPAQSRKYKTIVTLAEQTLSPIEEKYGETYLHSLLGTLRNQIVFGGISHYDAQIFSKMFAVTGEGSQWTPNDIIEQNQPFHAVANLISDNKPTPARQIVTEFIPKDEYKTAKVQVDKEAGEFWLQNRNEQ
ncbi:type IV secretory system conjugative DNA transfer family protein [Bacillus sp. AFS040349]|uniref:type IV secretory system conjugative DNA transfer family protein n=1 Tax=Bacillus sp. AFS040349 TaxID=2033502 RepID=UPI000BFB1C19|nr:TraM recognition domain-containing protein [Bacillus sp. AFS040349]PGT82217.1 hypothetical protein COD11_15590 [Bacillus sp. AFS040349]